MTMTQPQMIVTLLLVMAATVLTRFIFFWLFPAGKPTPAFVLYLGKVLPAAAMGMLVIYCYKSVDFTQGSHGLPELLAGALVVVLQKWKKNMFLSIVAGTACYMVLIRLVFA